MDCYLLSGWKKCFWTSKTTGKKKSAVPVTWCLWSKGTKLSAEPFVGCDFFFFFPPLVSSTWNIFYRGFSFCRLYGRSGASILQSKTRCMILQIWYKYVDPFHCVSCQNLPKLLNKMNPSQNFSGFTFVWRITNFLSLERPEVCKDPPRTLCFLLEEMSLTERDSGDSAIQDLL